MLTVEQVEEILTEIVGPDERSVDVQFPHVSVNTRNSDRYDKLVDQILPRLIEVSGTDGHMTFGYTDAGGTEPPGAGVREPRRPHPARPPESAEIPKPTP